MLLRKEAINKIFWVIFISFLFCVSGLYAENKQDTIEIYGNVYKIKEKNPAFEIHNQIAAQKDLIDKKLNKLKSNLAETIKNKIKTLPGINKNKVNIIDTTYTLDKDKVIYDRAGNPFYYPKGTKINIIEYLPFLTTYIVINPNNIKEIKWIKKYIDIEKITNVKLIFAGIPKKYNIFETLGQEYPYIYLTNELLNFFKLEGTIAVIKKINNSLVVLYFDKNTKYTKKL